MVAARSRPPEWFFCGRSSPRTWKLAKGGQRLPSLLAPLESELWQQRLDAVPALGQHTDSILGELGYSSDEIAQLRGDAAV
jgi:crotonobetainyl-CoA:carnitine CoA-transferase CaiB-like acyl-CoA transferase